MKISYKKFLICSLVFMYSININSDLVFAKNKKKNSKKTSKKQNSKRSVSSVSTAEVSTGNVVNIIEVDTVDNIIEQSLPNNINNNSNNVINNVEEYLETKSNNSETPDMSKDSEWENFRICMQSNCSGSDDQPNNVECYKFITFDKSFESCKDLITENKHEDFKNYFSGVFLTKEKKDFCEGETYSGKFDETTGKCALTVKFKRNAYNGPSSEFSCSAIEKTKTWYLDNKVYFCSGENFGVSDCYKESANYNTGKFEKTMGYVTTGIGAFSGLLSGIVTTKNYISSNNKNKTDASANISTSPLTDTSTTSTSTNTNTTSSTTTTSNKDTANKTESDLAVWNGIKAGLDTSSTQVTDGIGQIAKGTLQMKEKGEKVTGTCVLPDGRILFEGNSIKLSW